MVLENMNIKAMIKKIIPVKCLEKWKKFQESRIMYRESRETFYYAEKQREKKAKDKIVLAFIIYMPEVWNSLRSIHDFAEKDDRFETYIIAQPVISLLGKSVGKGENKAFEYLSTLYDDVINPYNLSTDSWIDLAELKPDYVFYTRPYNMEYYDLYRPCEVRKYAKVCMVPYGYNVINNYITDECYNVDFLRYVSILFTTSLSTLEKTQIRYRREYQKGFIKIECLGFPRFDLLYSSNKEYKEKKSTLILWTPRWTAGSDTSHMFSNFLKYKNNFLDFMKLNPEFELIIRPHPLMFVNYIQQGIMSEDAIDQFRKECQEAGNIRIDENKDYLPALKEADIIISDFSSLLMEYFVIGKPVIYCDIPFEFSPEGKKMDQYFEHADSWEEIHSMIIKLQKEKNDYIDQIKETGIIPANLGSIGKDILEYIAADYRRTV